MSGSRVRRWLEGKARSFQSQVVVLLYHRVFKPQVDPQLICVSSDHFAEQLENLKRTYPVLKLSELAGALRENRLPRRAAVLTFDDGYKDNLDNAKPLLEKYDLPATVFITSGFLGSEKEFWWDTLEKLLLHPGNLPEMLKLDIGGHDYQWKLDPASHYEEIDFERNRGWNVLKKEEPGPRQHLYCALHRLLLPLKPGLREKALHELSKWAGPAVIDSRSQILSAGEVFSLARGELIEIGSHSVTHPILSQLTAPEQKSEIRQSKDCLEEILGMPVASFSYPYGSPEDYTEETIDLVRAAGYKYACSNFADLVRRKTDCFQIPRILVRDWDGDEFGRRLRKWFHD